jgi:hypothetical protein
MPPTSITDQYQALLNRPAYLPEPVFDPAFHAFTEGYNSLCRYWALMNAHQQRITDELDAWPTDGQAEQELLKSGTVDVDKSAFPQFLRHSVLSMALGLAEDLLHRLSDHPAQASGPAYGAPSLAAPFLTNLAHRLPRMKPTAIEGAEHADPSKAQDDLRGPGAPARSTYLADLIQMVDQLAAETADPGAMLETEDVEVTLHHLSDLVRSYERAYHNQMIK